MSAIFKKELRSFLTTPVGYVFIIVYLAITGTTFSIYSVQNAISGSSANYYQYFLICIIGCAILLPILTMRSFSEEKRLKTEQVLLTSSVSLWQIVLAKYFACLVIFAGTEALTASYYIIPALYGKANYSVLFGGILGVFLMGAAFIAVGIFVSGLTENQVIAASGTIGIILALLLSDILSELLQTNESFAQSFIGKAICGFLSWLSVLSRIGYFEYGQLDITALIYYASLAFVFLFLTVRVYQRRRWA